ncbi:MAG: 5'/3'-nucleotidase SurE [Deltaproteobacteria bacterium CG11_big_fil_rev_8_21_14_0_20_47_16]|nr:MAG: 5'/3'-nucleotidase SurE [Deltaproteobacteria bacterium CG11_big_fil_rev_8_21_14_0_20_47_16]
MKKRAPRIELTQSIESRRPLILVTNDDGVYADGIKALAKRLRQIGRVIVVAPSQERSATSHSLTLHRPLRIIKISKDVYAVDGTPTDCVNLGVNEILPRMPDLVASGINRGGNLGDDVHYSGTVSAAVEGAIMGIPAIAFSCVARDNFKYQAAGNFAVRICKKVLRQGLPPGIVLNVNIPNLPQNKVRGYVFTKQGKRDYGDIIEEKVDPRGRKYYWIGGDDVGFEDIPGSDCNAIHNAKISITPIRVNLTDHNLLTRLKNWKL